MRDLVFVSEEYWYVLLRVEELRWLRRIRSPKGSLCLMLSLKGAKGMTKSEHAYLGNGEELEEFFCKKFVVPVVASNVRNELVNVFRS